MRSSIRSFQLAQRTLQRANDLVGDPAVLARRLHVPLDDLRSWLQGSDVPPKSVFFAAVDILCETDEEALQAKSGPFVGGTATTLR